MIEFRPGKLLLFLLFLLLVWILQTQDSSVSPSVIKGKVDRSRGGGDPTPTSLEKSSKSGQLDLFRKEDLRVYGANKKVNPPLRPPTACHPTCVLFAQIYH